MKSSQKTARPTLSVQDPNTKRHRFHKRVQSFGSYFDNAHSFKKSAMDQLQNAVGDNSEGGLNFTVTDLRLFPKTFGSRLPRPYFSASTK